MVRRSVHAELVFGAFWFDFPVLMLNWGCFAVNSLAIPGFMR
jgi:hypothetical protein